MRQRVALYRDPAFDAAAAAAARGDAMQDSEDDDDGADDVPEVRHHAHLRLLGRGVRELAGMSRGSRALRAEHRA